MRVLLTLMKDDSGAAIAEYGLIAAIVGAAIAVGSMALGSAVTSALHNDNCQSDQSC